MDVTIRAASDADLPAVKAIYDGYIATSVATFDLEPSDPASWVAKLPHLYVAVDDSGEVLGFCYSSQYRAKPAYDATVETTVYVADGQTGRGVGPLLYETLIERLRADGVHTAIAVLASPNPESERLHERFGFVRTGVQREVGFKLGRYVDTVIYQLML